MSVSFIIRNKINLCLIHLDMQSKGLVIVIHLIQIFKHLSACCNLKEQLQLQAYKKVSFIALHTPCSKVFLCVCTSLYNRKCWQSLKKGKKKKTCKKESKNLSINNQNPYQQMYRI